MSSVIELELTSEEVEALESLKDFYNVVTIDEVVEILIEEMIEKERDRLAFEEEFAPKEV
jgi:predicted metal-dependent hydrolase